MSPKHTKPKRANIYIDEMLHRQAKAKATLAGYRSFSEYVASLIQKDLNGK